METKRVLFDLGCRASTVVRRSLAVERAILTMRERLNEPLSLQDMAEAAFLSPSHFNRVFRHITGVPPGVFLTALRLERAKRLFLTTRLSIRDVCREVGYTSLGTFMERFTQSFGLPPARLRRLAEEVVATWCPERLYDYDTDLLRVVPACAGLTGHVSAPDPFAGLIFVGFFPTPLPQDPPVGCALVPESGTYCIAPVPDGHYYLLATALALSEDPIAYLLTEAGLRRSASQSSLLVRAGQVSGHMDVTLRPTQLTDPPILVTLPLLLPEWSRYRYQDCRLTYRGRWQGMHQC